MVVQHLRDDPVISVQVGNHLLRRALRAVVREATHIGEQEGQFTPAAVHAILELATNNRV